jgi:hypothetical protein
MVPSPEPASSWPDTGYQHWQPISPSPPADNYGLGGSPYVFFRQDRVGRHGRRFRAEVLRDRGR